MNHKLEVFPTRIAGCVKILFPNHLDPRGTFEETWHMEKFLRAGLPTRWPQDNMSISFKNVLRGMHLQKHNPQAKLVRCFAGSIYDVCVDLRPGSETFGQWEACYLNWEHPLGFFIPPGCAHGFMVTAESAMVYYKCSRMYDQASDGGVCWNDPDLKIEWPFEKGAELMISPKDQTLPSFRDYAKSIGVTL